MNQVVVVVSFFPWFDLVKVHYEGDSVEFFIDIKLLSLIPDNACTIILNLLCVASLFLFLFVIILMAIPGKKCVIVVTEIDIKIKILLRYQQNIWAIQALKVLLLPA